MAPGATINYVVSASTTTTDGVDLSALYIVDNNLAPVLSESYGACEASMGTSGVQFYGALWQQAAAQGISVFVSSGDSGAAGCDDPGATSSLGLQVNGIASTPFNAAVGGTDFNQFQAWSTYWDSSNDPITKQSAKGYIPETPWNDSCTNPVVQSLPGGSTNVEANCNNSTFKSLLDSTGGGGGQSSTWLKPAWQTGTPNDNARDLPDISLFASNGFLDSYYLVCQSRTHGGACDFGVFQAFGGTSVSSPQFAGIMALINQKTGSAQGIPGLTLYKLAAQHPSAFHDIPAGFTIAMPCVTGSLNCTTTNAGDAYGILSGYNTASGYDLATGLGSVDVANLVNQWQSISFTPSSTTLSMNGGAAVNITHGSAVSFSINVTPSAATGAVALMVAPAMPGKPGIAAFPLTSGAVATSTALLPGGSYSILAHYSGDSIYGGSYSNSVPVTVSPETSTAFVNLVTTNVNGVPTSYSASSATYGDGYQFLRVDVGDVNASVSASTGISSQCFSRKESCPTGKVVLSAPGTSLDGMVLQLNSEGYAQVAAPPPGTYSITATYLGDASFGASAATTAFSTGRAPTTTVVSGSGNPVQYGNYEDVIANLVTTSDGVAPTGTFQFFQDGMSVSTPQTIYANEGYDGLINGIRKYARANGALLELFLSIGNHTVSAQYSGDANYAASTSPVATISVIKAKAAFSSLSASNTAGGQVVAGLSAIASANLNGSQGLVPTGNITFYNSNVAIPGTVTYTSTSGYLGAKLPIVFPTPGTYLIRADYSGDANYTSATYPAQPVVVVGPVSMTRGPVIVIPSPGLGGSTSLAVIANGGFSGTAAISCTPDSNAKETTCSLTSGSSTGSTVLVNVVGSGSTMTLNVTTTAAHQARIDGPSLGTTSKIAFAVMLAVFLPAFRRRRKYALCFLGMFLALGLGACSGAGGGGNAISGSTDSGTALAQYYFTVTETTGSRSSQLSTSVQVPVLVN